MSPGRDLARLHMLSRSCGQRPLRWDFWGSQNLALTDAAASVPFGRGADEQTPSFSASRPSKYLLAPLKPFACPAPRDSRLAGPLGARSSAGFNRCGPDARFNCGCSSNLNIILLPGEPPERDRSRASPPDSGTPRHRPHCRLQGKQKGGKKQSGEEEANLITDGKHWKWHQD